MNLKSSITAGVILLVAIVGSLMLVAHNARQDGMAQARAELHQQYLASVDSLDRDWQARLLALEAAYAEAARVDTVTRTRYRTLRDTLTITDTVMVREALDRCDASLAACDSVNVVLLGRVALASERGDTLSQALERTREAWQTEMKRRRGFLHSIRTGLPYAAAGLLAGILLK